MREKERHPILSVTKEDCDWQTFRSGGAGGQNVNKVSSAVRCVHRASGAVGRATDTRDQYRNRRLAFRRMAESKTFRDWLKAEIARRLMSKQTADEIEVAVDAAMDESNLKVEFF